MFNSLLCKRLQLFNSVAVAVVNGVPAFGDLSQFGTEDYRNHTMAWEVRVGPFHRTRFRRLESPRIHVVAALGVALLCINACSSNEGGSGFTVTNAKVEEFAKSIRPSEPMLKLVLERTFGEADGSNDEVLSYIIDAKFGKDGSIFLAQPNEHRVVHLDSVGKLIRTIGGKGAGPGEMIMPFRLSVSETEVSVYDRALGRISIFDMAGVFLRSVGTGTASLIGDVVGLENHSFAISAPFGSTTGALALLDSTGSVVPSSVVQARTDSTQMSGVSEPARLCRSESGGLIFSNPWVYELVSTAADLEKVHWSRRFNSAVLTPVASDEKVTPVLVRQGVSPLGLACGRSGVVVAYMKLSNGAIYYDLLGSDGSARARFTYDAKTDTVYPGFLGDMTDSLLLTFRNKPFPHVSLFRIDEARK